MLEGEGNVRPQGPNFLGLPCLHRDTVTFCSLPFGCLGVIAYRPSVAGWIWLGGAVQAGAELPSSDVGSACCWAGSRSGGGELLRGILYSIWPASGYPALGCLVGKQCVWWEELVGLMRWLQLSTLGLCLSKIPAWSLCLGPSCLIFNLGSAGKGADLDRQPQSCSVLDGLLGEQPLSLPCQPCVLLPPSLRWLSWEEKVLPDSVGHLRCCP